MVRRPGLATGDDRGDFPVAIIFLERNNKRQTDVYFQSV
jgi:hypothetical protein